MDEKKDSREGRRKDDVKMFTPGENPEMKPIRASTIEEPPPEPLVRTEPRTDSPSGRPAHLRVVPTPVSAEYDKWISHFQYDYVPPYDVRHRMRLKNP